MEVDLETWIVGARHVVGCLLLEAFRAGEPTAQGLQGERAIEPRLLRQGERLAEGGEVHRHDDLVGELGEATCSQRPQVRDGLTEGLEDREGRVEVGLLTPHHDAQRTIDGALLSARHGRIQHAHALRRESPANLLRNDRRNGRHIEEKQPLACALDDAVLAKGDLFHLGRVGQHGDEHVDLGRHVPGRRAALGSRSDDLLNRPLAPAVDDDGETGLDQVLGHGSTHDPEPNHSNGLRHDHPHEGERMEGRRQTRNA